MAIFMPFPYINAKSDSKHTDIMGEENSVFINQFLSRIMIRIYNYDFDMLF